MTSLPHRYSVHLTGGPTGYAEMAMDGVEPLRSAPPIEFGGPGDAWTPEHLLLASVEGCYLFTLRAVARAARVDFLSLDVTAEGTVDRQNGATRFTEIVLRPELVLHHETPLDRVMSMLEKTERHCLVSASISTPIHVEPRIIREGTLVEAVFDAREPVHQNR